MEFRHEWKHRITYGDMLVLRQRLGAALEPDAHSPQGRYFVRSLYFDDPADRALREKLEGVNCREKFRIRYYNMDPGLIRLEKKCRRNGLSSKETENLTCREVRALLAGDLGWMEAPDRPLVRELYEKMRTRLLRPRTIVDYTREAFVYRPGNVRVTLDYDIRTGLAGVDLLRPDCVTLPAGDHPIVLEVKWDAYLPSLVRDLVQLEGRQTTAFSKYALCRIYD